MKSPNKKHLAMGTAGGAVLSTTSWLAVEKVASDERNRKLEESLNKAEEQLKKVQLTNEEKEKLIVKLNTQTDQLKGEIQQAKEANRTLQESSSRTIARIKEAANLEKEALKERLYAIAYDSKQLRRRFDAQKKVLESMIKTYNALKAGFDKLKELNDEQRQALIQLSNEIEKIKRELIITRDNTADALLGFADELDENDEYRIAIRQLLEKNNARVVVGGIEFDLPSTQWLVDIRKDEENGGWIFRMNEDTFKQWVRIACDNGVCTIEGIPSPIPGANFEQQQGDNHWPTRTQIHGLV